MSLFITSEGKMPGKRHCGLMNAIYIGLCDLVGGSQHPVS